MSKSETICHWSQEPGDDVWTTECKSDFAFATPDEPIRTTVGPQFHGFNFCPFCGGDIYENAPETSNEDLAYESAAGK